MKLVEVVLKAWKLALLQPDDTGRHLRLCLDLDQLDFAICFIIRVTSAVF